VAALSSHHKNVPSAAAQSLAELLAAPTEGPGGDHVKALLQERGVATLAAAIATPSAVGAILELLEARSDASAAAALRLLTVLLDKDAEATAAALFTRTAELGAALKSCSSVVAAPHVREAAQAAVAKLRALAPSEGFAQAVGPVSETSSGLGEINVVDDYAAA
jgi:hypothetical protein